MEQYIMEGLMTVALIMYFVAYFVARHGGRYFMLHPYVATLAFAFDAYGTWMMFQMDVDYSGWIPLTHTILTVIALSLFFVQGSLGLLSMRKWHILFAQYIFLPMWVISFLSGFLFFL